MEKKKKKAAICIVSKKLGNFLWATAVQAQKKEKKNDEYYMSRKMGKNVIQQLLSLS